MDPVDNILKECLEETIMESDSPVSQKYIELHEVGFMDKLKSRLKPTVVTKIEKAADSSRKATRRVRMSAIEVGKTARSIRAIAVTAFVFMVLKKVRDIYRNMVHKRCSKFKDDELYLCKIQTLEFTIHELNSYKNDCKNTNDPESCKMKIDKAIEKLLTQREKLKNKLIRTR